MSIVHICPFCKKTFEFSMIGGNDLMNQHYKECEKKKEFDGSQYRKKIINKLIDHAEKLPW